MQKSFVGSREEQVNLLSERFVLAMTSISSDYIRNVFFDRVYGLEETRHELFRLARLADGSRGSSAAVRDFAKIRIREGAVRKLELQDCERLDEIEQRLDMAIPAWKQESARLLTTAIELRRAAVVP